MTKLVQPLDVLLIVVHYGDAKVTLRLLQSLSTLSQIERVAVLVVNNGPQEHLNLDLQSPATLPNLLSVKPQKNLGYFGGAKAGIDYYVRYRGALPNWMVIANNDVIASDHLFFEKLFSWDSTQVGILAPRILSTRTGCDQNPFLRQRPGRARMRELRFWLRSYHLAHLHEQLSYAKRASRRWFTRSGPEAKRSSSGGQESIYAPHGSFLILSRTFFDRGGYLDDAQFLYTEELTLGEMCRRLNLPVVYEPELKVTHDEHQSTGRKYSRKTHLHKQKAIEYLMKQYLSDVV